jgi:hypothetical protein
MLHGVKRRVEERARTGRVRPLRSVA